LNEEPDPGRRVLLATAAAIKLRQRRAGSRSHPRRAEALWLRANWPETLLLGIHRQRIGEQLAGDADLRRDVQDRLGLSLSPGLASVTSAADPASTLVTALRSAVNPRVVLEMAAVHPDERVARAAIPYLLNHLTLPAGTPAPAAERPSVPNTTVADDDGAWRRERDAARELRRQLKERTTAGEALEKQVAQLSDDLAKATAAISELRAKLPTSRERKALQQAGESARAIEDLRKQVHRERRTRLAEHERHEIERKELEAALHQVEEQRDSEQRGRRRLENALGDAAERASRLAPLVKREARDLEKKLITMPNGKARTRTQQRADRLGRLATELSELYPNPGDRERSDDRDLEETATAPRPTLPGAQAPRVTTSPRGPRVTALGGASHIGGSALLIEAGTTRILVDAGLRPDANLSNLGPARIVEAVNDTLHAIVITHAHADHAGYVPWVLEQQRRAEILCSHETKALLPTVWSDSLRVMAAEASSASTNRSRTDPPYGEAEVMQAEDALRGLGYGQTRRVHDLEITLFKAGHILGAAGVVVRAGEWRVVVTGDIDDRPQASVGPAEIPPRLAHAADLLVIETTYCTSVHQDRNQEGLGLVRRAEEVLAAGGRILVPAFGLGRAQEIALLLSKELPDVDVLVDGLARDISDLYARNGAPQVLTGRVRKVESRGRQIQGFHNGIVITTSGMLTGGAAIPWAKAILPDPHNALFLCGHQDEEAPGRHLEELAAADPEQPRTVQLRDESGQLITVDVAATVHRYNLSAHADKSGLMRIIKQVDPKAIMLVHGEVSPQATFRRLLEASGRAVVDNRETWDPHLPAPDTRLARRRHASRVQQRR
jgi:Cft2 family RNA processing exonuclease